MKNNTATLKVFKSGNYEYIYIYFKSNNKVLRVNTNTQYKAYQMTKDLLFNSSVDNHRELNKATLELLEKVNGYIKFKLQEYKGSIDQKECLNYISSSNYVRGLNNVLIRINDFTGIETPITPQKTVMDYVQDFVISKEKKLKGNSNSLGNYWSLKKNLEEFQTLQGKALTFEQINTKDFVQDFRQYLSTLNPYKNNKKYLNASSVQMRLNYLRTFYLWLCECEVYTIKPNVYNIGKETFTSPKISLTKSELKQVQDLKGLNNKEQITVDMFVCNSLMGFRFSDLMQLNPQNIMKHKTGETFIRQTNQKTGTTVQIEVQPTSLNILLKYGFKFPTMSLKTFNDRLLSVLENNNLFNDLITIQQRQNNTVKDIQVMKRTLIHSHTSRRNFVNICLDANVPLNQIMTATGHTSLATVQKYMTRKTNVESFRQIDLSA